MEVTMSSAVAASTTDADADHDEAMYWWCPSCLGAVAWSLSSCFCCGADRPADPDRLTREECDQRAADRRRAEEDSR